MDLRQIEFFVAAARERTFTRAAESSHVSQPGLSASIRSLERELGARLFERSARGSHLTPAGRTLLPRARRMLDDAAAARRDVLEEDADTSAIVRIGAEPCLGVLVDLVDMLAAFRGRHPGIRLSLSHADSASLLTALRLGELDLAVVADTAQRPLPATAVELASEPFALIGASDGLAQRPRSLADLADETFADLGSGWGSRAIVEAAFAAQDLSRRVEFEVGDVHTLLDLVRRGLARAIVPAAIASKPHARGLARVPLDGLLPPWRIVLALDEAPTPAAGAFAGMLLPSHTRESLLRELFSVSRT